MTIDFFFFCHTGYYLRCNSILMRKEKNTSVIWRQRLCWLPRIGIWWCA